jgi:lysophospholipase L1-like esterase
MTKKLTVLLITFGFILLVGETGIRYHLKAWPFEPSLYAPPYLTAADAPLRWRYSSDKGRNSLGLRNREVGPKKRGTYRILFLGDSLIWSGETSSEELFTGVLERRLNAGFSGGANTIEIINAGIPGYTTYQELEFLRVYGMGLQPDLVILGFVFNDLYYKYLHRPSGGNLLNGDPTAELYRFNPYTFPGNIVAPSYLAHEMARRCEIMGKRLLKKPEFSFERRLDFYLAWKEYGWKHLPQLLGEMRSLVTEGGASLMVLVFPIRDQMDDAYRKIDAAYVLFPQTMIRRVCADYAIPLVDLTDSLYRNGGQALFKDYLHLNGKGNDVVAGELERYLVDRLGGGQFGEKSRSGEGAREP